MQNLQGGQAPFKLECTSSRQQFHNPILHSPDSSTKAHQTRTELICQEPYPASHQIPTNGQRRHLPDLLPAHRGLRQQYEEGGTRCGNGTLVDLELLELVVVLQEVHLGRLRLRVRRRRCRCHQRCALRRGRADERGASRNGGGEKGSGEKRGYRGREHQPASRAGRRSGTETLARPGGAVRPCGGWLAALWSLGAGLAEWRVDPDRLT